MSDGKFALLFIGSCIAVFLVIKLYRKYQGSNERIVAEDTYPLGLLIAFLALFLFF